MPDLLTEKWSIANPPPEGDEGVGKFFLGLFEAARAAKEAQNQPERVRMNYQLNRGAHWQSQQSQHKKYQVTFNLQAFYREKNVISMCSRDPKAEVKVVNEIPLKSLPADGQEDGAIRDNLVMNTKLESLWAEAKLKRIHRRAIHLAETYGTQVSRFVPMLQPTKIDGEILYRCLAPVIDPGDPSAHFPAPGNYGQPCEGAYHIVATIWPVATAKRFYRRTLPDGKVVEPNIQGNEDLARDTLALDRQSMTPAVRTSILDGDGFSSDYVGSKNRSQGISESDGGKVLILECWIRDATQETIQVAVTEPVRDETGAEMMDEAGKTLMQPAMRSVVAPDGSQTMEPVTQPEQRDKYPGRVRMVTITADGEHVLRDLPNPNVNSELSREFTQNTFLFDKFPFYKSVSYFDEQSFWGYSLAEQIGPLNLKIDELVSKLVSGAMMQIHPILVLPKDTGLSAKSIKIKPNMIIQPAYSGMTKGIYFIEHPGMGQDAKWLLQFLLQQSDQLASHQEVDRGESPGGVIAASAITALQEQSRTMRENKIAESDAYIEWIGQCMISYLQNFHWEEETIIVQDKPVKFCGQDHIRYKYRYDVVKGSTFIQSDSQKRQDSIEEYKLGAIDTLQLLRDLGRSDAEEIFARMYGEPLAKAIEAMLNAKVITPQDAALIRGKLQAIMAGQVPEHSGMEAPLPGLQASAAGGAQPALPPQQAQATQAGQAPNQTGGSA